MAMGGRDCQGDPCRFMPDRMTKDEERRARLAENLRENLRRRKAQARAAVPEPEPDPQQ